eukprot:CAMPEP_0181439578 /NCGR_PEP_ID=MMETSP1110-20121109/22503_1 /TAXON_ID=174948 /ORGANISM="Symbiodinium sp., Strain CCMP421" /LENGTH=303 /DNA_ID=CAMNT_0023563313 /DNA_START=37 /DNA_END=948 /DNA_ORIENTATION=+
MEFTVVTTSNAPPKPILAVHTGSVCRQMKLEVNHPFVLPNPGSTAAVEVSVFQQLASQLLPEDGKAETACTIPVRTPDGTATQVQLEIRREVLKGRPKSVQGIPEYLETHKVQQRIQNLIQDVLREAPDDPYRFMLHELKKIQAASPKKAVKEPLVPHPPDKPKPTGSRPLPGRAAPPVPVAPKVQIDKSDWRPSRHVLRQVLESPRCREVGEQSIVQGVCQKTSLGMAKCIMDTACDKVISKASGRNEIRALAATVVKATVAMAAHTLQLQKSGVLTKCTLRCAFIGALRRLGTDEVGEQPP